MFSRSVAGVGGLGREAAQCSRFRARRASLLKIARRHSQRHGIQGLEIMSTRWIILLIRMIAVITSLSPRSYVVADGEALTQGQGDGSVGGFSMMLGGWRTSRNPSSEDAAHKKQQRRLQNSIGANVNLSESVITIAEGGVTATYTVVLDAAPNTTLNVELTSSPSSEIFLSATSLEFTDMNWDAEQVVTVSAVDDDVVEQLKWVTIEHSVDVPENGFYVWDGTFSPSSSLMARVYDNDEQGVLISASTMYVNEGGSATYTIELMTSPSADVVISIVPSNGYVSTSRNDLTFTSATWSSPQTITVYGVEDSIQTAESYVAKIGHTASSSDALFDTTGVTFFPASKVSVVIYDNDEGCYRSCDPGYWAFPCNGTFECASCTPGYYCEGACTDPIACPAGTSVGGYGSTSAENCTACPDGYYASEEGSASCSACPAGYFCSSASAAPEICPAGKYSSAGASACSDCPDGFYNANSGRESCLNCPAGYECSDKASEPNECSPGSYSYGNAIMCEACPAGYYCSTTGSSPEVCSNGSYSLSNWQYCVVCPPGHYCMNTNQVPKICAAGTASLGGSTFCTTCASGTYSSVEGSTSCSNCPAGSSCLDVSNEPLPCTNGTYSLLGNALCSDCEAGTYSISGATSCLACPIGHSCFNPVSSPTLCEEGYYSNGGKVMACSICDPGTYTDPSRDQCLPCIAGFECRDPTVGPVKCEDGYYSTAGATVCTACPAGSYCASPFTLPHACDPGTYSVSASMSCTVCPGGYYCSTPSEPPVACSDGQYSPEGSSACMTCPAGFYCPGPVRDEESKAPCSAGQYSLDGWSSCSECPKGHFCPDTSLAPQECPDGYYTDLGNMTACERCSAGNYCPSAAMPEQPCPRGFYSFDGASSCTECTPGFHCPTTASTPIACRPGTFSLAQATNCTSCPPGFYCPNTDSADFYECPDGTYSTGEASSCESCSASHYCPLTTVAMELPCPDGYYSVGGATNCTICGAGLACTSDGSSIMPCEPGYYSKAGVADCTPCPRGYYCPDTGSDTVWECPAGSYSEGLQQVCVECQAGYYCPHLDSSEAFPCLAGSYSVGGQATCTECPAGFACSSTFTDQMVACGEGYYSSLGAFLCTACPAGYRCPYTSDNPIACDVGYYSTVASVNCTPCPAGYSCNDPEAMPQPCEVGYYSAGGSSMCSACQPGYRCPESSVSATPAGSECPEGTYCNPARTLTECPAGTYGNVTAAASESEGCQSCTEGYYCSGTGNTPVTRQICPAGYYCPTGSSLPTACAAGLYNSLLGSWSKDDCTECPAGYYCTRGSSSGTSTVCTAGNYCPANTPSAASYPCPAGTYSSDTGLIDQSQCLECPPGDYCPEGSTAPLACRVGTYQPATSATDASACLACEPGWACPSTGMWEMTTRCGTGSYCPAGTSYRTQHACDAGTYTDSTNLTSANQCSPCPERKSCPSGSTSVDWSNCGSGHYCPVGTPSRTSYPCPAGSYTDRVDLADASECYPCPVGSWCGGSGSNKPDGPCEAGYYCPLSTKAATDYPCPAGTYSDSTSLYLESQCQDCPPGYYCPEASTTITACPAGTYSPYNATEDSGPGAFPSCTSCPAGSYCVEASVEPVPCGVGRFSDDGADMCTVCEAGHYCGSNETSASQMYTGGRSWDAASDDAGVCFGGTYCAAGMDRAPDRLRDACKAGYYCPVGVASPKACPSGTFNPHEGMDDEDDCQISWAGYYTVEGSSNMTGVCSTGYYCPEGSTGPRQVPCPERYYRANLGAKSQDDCALCVSGGYCPSGSSEPLECPRGYYCVTGVSDPEPCPLGTYGNTTALRKISDCIDCDAGYYCDQRGLTAPAGLCDPGYYCLDGSYTSAPNAPGSPLLADESDIGGLCQAGGYCPLGSSYSQPCPAGTYNNFSGAADPADCSDCPPGFYCSGTNNPSPTGPCASGYYCTGGASTPTQHIVEAGYYSTPGASQQYPCQPGTWNSEVGMTECLACFPGYYCPDSASTTVTTCPAGSYCPEGSDVHQLCPAGTYSPQSGLQNQSQCIACDPGKYCSSNGWTSTSGDCEAGYYCTSGALISNPIGQSYGDLCPSGHFCEEGTAWPEPCPTGTYYGTEANDGDIWYNDTITGILYRSYCTLCPATYACNATGLMEPDVMCAEGYFCKLGASSPSPYCETGEGLCDYGICPSGHYCPTGTSDPISCPPGTFMNNTGAAECFECPERYYCDGSFPQGYVECPVGHFCPAGTEASLPDCPPGTFSAQTGLASSTECTDCIAGQYCAVSGLIAPDGTCDAGYYCPPGSKNSHGATAEETEHVCPPGRYCGAGLANPLLCPVGTYNPSEGITANEDCTPCSSGHFCETTGLLAPTGPCHGGYYCKRGVEEAAPTSGTHTVGLLEYGGHLCPPGTFCPNGTHTPLACDAGTYNDLVGQEECFPCPPGFYCGAYATEYESSLCPAGYYCPEGTRYANEFPCPPGTYSSVTRISSLSECVDAPAGKYVTGWASMWISGTCAEGFYCTGASSSATPVCVEAANGECETGGPCTAGQYCPEGSQYPEPCPGGSYCGDTSGVITGNCLAGYYCKQGSWTPSPVNETDENGIVGGICFAGHYCPEGSVTPIACMAGTYSASDGNRNSTACLPCEPGLMCPDAATTVPVVPCPAGFYCPAGTAEATLQCGAGQACVVSSWEPTDCPAGTFQPSTGQDSCLPCPEGYYCLSGANSATDCPAGYYCPEGTRWGTEHGCPIGTFSDSTNLRTSSECTSCTSGSYCSESGISEPTGQCDEGYYCNGGANVRNPDSSSSDGYRGDTCINRTDAASNDLCPPGHYCPVGSGAPVPCPSGTSSSAFRLASESDCAPCDPGFYCPDSGSYNSEVECTEGFFCPGGDASPSNICPKGHYCPAGSIGPLGCNAGTYQDDTSAVSCEVCPPGYYCPAKAVEASICPAGYFCIEGTTFGTEFPCPNGTYSNETGLADVSECSLCDPGRFCGSEGLTEPEGLCEAGYYCAIGAASPVPAGETDASVGGLCAPGYACVKGAKSPQPVDGITGYECPRGTYCPAGSSFPIGCPPGSYNPSEAMEVCATCTAGSICPGNSTAPEECPIYHYCPAGSAAGITCPAGTYGSRTDLEAETECSPCPAGQYCVDGTITDLCRAGYFCKTGAGVATPNSAYADSTYEFYNDIWETLDGGPCPAGHYCPSGTEDPKQCLNASVRVSLLGVSPDDCGVCPAGFICLPGDPIPEQCYTGHYCPQGEDPIPCPIGTHNPNLEQDDQDDCLACPAGSYCNMEGIGNYTQYPCPAGHFCLKRDTSPKECPEGTYRSDTGATSAEDCHLCPGGFMCTEPRTLTPRPCPKGTFCLPGASNTTTCPAGYYCPVETNAPIICPKGHFCIYGSSDPTACVLGTYCPEGSEIFTSCPLGWHGSLSSNNTLGSRDEACEECPPGTYGTDPERLVCNTCPGGYVCLGTTTSATPTSVEDDRGFECTPGHYCPPGSSYEIACSPGSYNPRRRSAAASDCLPCPADHYQDQEKSFSCLPCSSSSTSEPGSTECNCLGLNRAFQLSDGQCICRSGYEYYNEGGVLESTVDGAVDCQPIVYERCYTGEALDVDGECLSDSDCDAQCGEDGGKFYEHIGLCECHGLQDLNEVCDESCRDGAALMFIDPATGLIVIVEGNSSAYVDPDNLPSFAGALYCPDDAGCSLVPVTVSTNFAGVFGTGDAVSSAASTSSASRRRRGLRSTTRSYLQDSVWDEDVVHVIDEELLEPVRRDINGRGNARKSEAPAVTDTSMVERFLRRRAENYRPLNPYRNRFFGGDGTEISVPGAIPLHQRPSPLPKESSLQDRPHHDNTSSWEAGWGENEWEEGRGTQTRRRAGKRSRKLGASSAQPAIEHPLSCVSEGDSVLFDISSGCYPVYEKDSLLNSNLEFDYGEFRHVAVLATSSATYDTFGFVFEEAGTYVFSSSCNPLSIFVVTVMDKDVSCTTDASFVPLTAANLIKLGVGKNSDNITLSPDWALIFGLLGGIAFMVLGVVVAVYYFRTRAWVTGRPPFPTYRSKAQTTSLKTTEDDLRQKPGFFNRRSNKVQPLDQDASQNLFNEHSRIVGSGDMNDMEDPEMQEIASIAGVEDDPNVRDLVDRIQKYHDVVEKEFTGQKDLVLKLHHLLEQEADELKRLLGAKAGTIGKHTSDPMATRATLAWLKTDAASRRMHEAGVSTAEVKALSALKHLQGLFEEGPESFTERVMQEIASPKMASKDNHVEGRASSPLLREVQETAELLRAEVVDNIGERLEREAQREHDARVVLEGAVSSGRVNLPEDVARSLKTTGELDAKTDGEEREIVSTLRLLADRLSAYVQELVASEGSVTRNLKRSRDMGNTSLEETERQRGQQAIAAILNQLNEAMEVVGDKADVKKEAVDSARNDAEVERAHLETLIDNAIRALGLEYAKSAEASPTATSDDLQGLLKEIHNLVSSSSTPTAVAGPTAAASEMFSKVAANEYRRHSMGYDDDSAEGSAIGLSEVDEAIRTAEVQAKLMLEQEAGEAMAAEAAESEKKGLEQVLQQEGASAEEKEVLMEALAEDQRAIKDILEEERLRVEETLRAATAARKAMDDSLAEEDAAGPEESRTKAELLRQQEMEIKELRRKHEEAQRAIMEESIKDMETENGEDEMGLLKALREAYSKQTGMLEACIAAKAKSQQQSLKERLRSRRAKREAEIMASGMAASDAIIEADKELEAEERAARDQLNARLAMDRENALTAIAREQRDICDAITKDPTVAVAITEGEVRRIREEAVKAIQEVEEALTAEAKPRRRARSDRLKAKHIAKQEELAKQGVSEEEWRERDADLTRMEELDAEALEESIQAEREVALKEIRLRAAAAEIAAKFACSQASEAEIDPRELDASSRLKDLHLAAIEKMERDLGRKQKSASRALRSRLQEARAAREEELKIKDNISASEASARARLELEEAEEKAQETLVEDLANGRLKAIERENVEAEAAAVAGSSIWEEADRVLREHTERIKVLRKEMKMHAEQRRDNLQKRLATRRRGKDAIISNAQRMSDEAASMAAAAAEAAEGAERDALEQNLTDEEARFEQDAEDFERLIKEMLMTAASGSLSLPSWAAIAVDTTDSNQAKRQDLRRMHEREIAAMEMCQESKRRAAATRHARRRAAARAAREEMLRLAGINEEEIAKELAEEDARAIEEAKQEDASIRAEGKAAMEEERIKQMAATADDLDFEKEIARIRDKHDGDMAALERELGNYCRNQKTAQLNHFNTRREAKKEALLRAGANDEEIAEAMKALAFEEVRDALQLEEMLRSMEQAEISAFKHAASLASGQSDDSEAALAELRALRHENEVLLKDSLRAEAAASRSRLRQKIAGRVAERVRELRDKGSVPDMIAAEEAAIRAAGEAEATMLEAVLARESEGRVRAAHQASLSAETALKARKDEARKLRERHEGAIADLSKKMAEKKRKGREALAALLQDKKSKRMAELGKAGAGKQEVADELARLEAESAVEERRVQEAVDQEAAARIEAERNSLAQREAEAHIAELVANNSRCAGEAEVERLRREHERQQRTLESTLEDKRKLRHKELLDKMAHQMNAAMASAASLEDQQKLLAELEKERIAATKAFDEEIARETCLKMEEKARQQARAEATARASAQAAVDEAENRARLAREEHEQSSKKLEEQMVSAKAAQEGKLRDKLAKKRRKREEQLKHENANAEAIEAARRKMEEEEARELANLEKHLQSERERLQAESLARAAEKRAREEAQASAKAIADAEAAAAAKKEAEECLRRLQQEHGEKNATLEHQMEEERRTRESKLRGRLAKKRKAKEEEMQKAAISDREKEAERKRLEDEERAEQQRIQDQLEEEKARLIETQRRLQEEALAAAAVDAARVAEIAAAASARAAAADAIREVANAAEQEEFKRKVQKIREINEASEEQARRNLAGSSATQKAKLADRLAKKKAQAEVQKRRLEEAQKAEEERLLAKHREESEAARAAAAPGWSGDIAWDEAVMVAMGKPPQQGETQQDQEARVLKSVLEADIVPDSKIIKCVELVMSWRHEKETADLLTAQYKERASRLAHSLGGLLAEKNQARAETLQRLAKADLSLEERSKVISEVDDMFEGRQRDLEIKIVEEMEALQLEQQLELRQLHLREVAGTVKSIAPEATVKQLQDIAVSKHESELQNYRAVMEREKEERIRKIQEERTRFEEGIHRRHEEEMKRLQAEEETILALEREAQEARMNQKKLELERQKAEEQKKLEEQSGQLDAKEKEALLERFKRDQVASLDALKAEEATQKSKLEQKLAARRTKKMQELKLQEESEIKKKEERDAQKLEVFEKQAKLAVEAETSALAASTSVDVEDAGLKIDQAAIESSRKAGGANEAKERLKQTLAESDSRRTFQRRASNSSAARDGAKGPNASAAAAAAVATAATATAYSHISQKLEGIEALISALKGSHEDAQKSGTKLHAPAEAYRDAEDAVIFPEGSDLKILRRMELPVQAIARVEFGEHLLSVLGLKNNVKLQMVKNLPAALLDTGGKIGGPDKTNANAFRNSYLWDPSNGTLYVHVRRLSSSGDFGLVLVHAAAHIQVDPSDVSSDLDPRFTQNFHRALKVLTQELFKHREAEDGLGRPNVRAASTAADSPKMQQRLDGDGTERREEEPTPRTTIVREAIKAADAIGGKDTSKDEFAQRAFAERLERYARASGHPRLVEFLSRHNDEQNDKFVLSDDDKDDQITGGNDATYMESYDKTDGDSILRSPHGSTIDTARSEEKSV